MHNKFKPEVDSLNYIKLEIEVPKDILENLKQSEDEFSKDMKMTMAIDSYTKGKLSLGKAAELSGFSKLGFIDILNYRGETIFNYTNDEIESEIQNIRTLSTSNGD